MSEVAPTPAPGDAFDELWSRLARPFDVISTMSALAGLSPAAVSQLVGTALATSVEAEDLLDSFPATIRSLATSIHTNAERCVGELRGPILWSETMSARASSFGDEGLFVCSTPSRAYDIDENQVLVAALVAVQEAGRAATDHTDLHGHDDPLVRAARHNSAEAGRFSLHPTLQNVRRVRPKPRAIKRTRAGKHHRYYEPALAMLTRAANPLSSDDARQWCDERTLAQHHVMMGLVTRLETSSGHRLPEFRAERGALYAGPLQYHHPRTIGEHSHLSGIVIGPLLVDVPTRLHDPNRRRAEDQLQRRAHGRHTMVVMNDSDIDRVIERAAELARTSG